MIFTTQCPSCEATFPIDSAKVPDGGVYARCSQCEGVFLVEVPVSEAAPFEARPAAVAPETEVDPVEVEPVEVEPAEFTAPPEPDAASSFAVERDFESEPDFEPEPEIEPEPPVAAETEPAVEAAPTMEAEHGAESGSDAAPPFEAAPPPEAPVAAPSFGKRDPSERAQRLARVLVSDMIAYHPDRHRRSLEEGTLKADFDEEIAKSWHEYVDQVGKELAESQPYFTDALNEILAKGNIVF